MEPNTLISTHNVTFVRQPYMALKDLTFALKAGECMVCLGANGTGKSTTLRLLSGLIPPDSGEIYIKGFNLITDPLNAKHSIGYLSERLPLYTELTVYEYFSLIARLRQIPKQIIRERIIENLENMNLTHLQHLVIGTLSKGQKQRVAIAQTMLHQPPVLLLDEPTNGLDPDQIESFVNQLMNYKKTSAIILVTHAIHEVAPLCDRVLQFYPSGVCVNDFHPCQT